MKIVKTPAKVLTKKTKPVKKFNKQLTLLVDKMTETLKTARNPEGVGLAAPQVGVLKRLFIMQVNADKKGEKPRYKTFINPEIIEVGNETPKNSYLASRSTPHQNKFGAGHEWDNLKKWETLTQSSEDAHRTSHISLHTSKILEGCLSIENVWGFPRRSSWIKLRYQDLSGKKLTQKLAGFPAVIVQHEIDHLNGILFTHRVLKQKGKLYKIEKDKKTKEPVLVALEL